MTDLFKLIFGILASRFKPRATLEAENLVLRQQVNVLRRQMPKRPHLNNTDRFLFVWLYRWFPSVREVVAIVSRRPSFARAYWRWRSRNRVGRPKVSVGGTSGPTGGARGAAVVAHLLPSCCDERRGRSLYGGANIGSLSGLPKALLQNAPKPRLHRSISPNTISSDPMIAETSANMWPHVRKSMAERWAKEGARILHLYGRLVPSETR